MADNIVDISILCPIKFRRQGFTNPLPYNSKYHDDWNYPDTVRNFEEQIPYWQPWQKNDIIYVPILSNYAGPHQLELYNCDDILIDTFQLNYEASSIEGTGMKFYIATVALATYAEGVYYFLLKSGSPVLDTLESEKIYVKTLHENTIQIRYTHNENDFDVVFENGLEFQLRVYGGMTEFKPASDRTVFVDQPRNMVQLSGKSYYTQKLLLGDANGIPDYLIERINQIFLCSDVLVDGKQYVASDGAQLEPSREKDYPLAGWALEVRPAEAQNKKRFTADGNQGTPTTIVYQIQSKGFGSISNPASNNTIQIEQV